jgi:O-methyltransferase
MTIRNHTKSRFRPLVKALLRRALVAHALGNEMLAEWACGKGWRPPSRITEDYPINASFGYEEEADIKRAVSIVRSNTMLSFERLATLWLQVRYIDSHGIGGDFVECGVWRGGASAMMALAHLHTSPAPTRHLHLFDSWQGLPEPDAKRDGARAVEYAGGVGNGALKPVGQCVATLDETKQLLEEVIAYPKELIHYHVGWFQETVPTADIGEIAILRLDGDWYESTRLCLEHLYHNVVEGGVVILDDYGYWAGCRTATDEFLRRQPKPIMLHHIDGDGRYFTKP